MTHYRTRRRGIALLLLCLAAATIIAQRVSARLPADLAALALPVVTVGVAAPLLGLWFRPRLRRRDRLAEALDAMAARGYQGRLPAESFKELAVIAERINHWAARWEEGEAASQRRAHQEQTILGAMDEGVIAIDYEHRITHLNAAATRLFQVDAEKAAGRLLEEVVRQPEVQRLACGAIRGGSAEEAEIQWHGAVPRVLQVRAGPMHGTTPPGAVLVVRDVTDLRRLEKAQRDFVANVSHEFKTPLTSLKGFVETLREGALDHPEEARRFVNIMGRQVDRLQSLVEDVLSLSRLEQEAQHQPPPREHQALRTVLLNAVEACTPAAERKNIQMDIQCEEGVTAYLNPTLVEQAAINLIDNAIKYSEAGTRVDIRVNRDREHWRVSVHDQGPGIENRHLPLIFDRFYRVDKARSRKAGGTGLGLSIVRHIAESHGGRVEVQSQLGQGSQFSLLLPVTAPIG